MAKSSIIEFVSPGGMTVLKEVPDQKGPYRNRYFDEFATYAPFQWMGSRRLNAEETAQLIREGTLLATETKESPF